MKSLKFSEPLPELILRGEKDTTWRIDDEKGNIVLIKPEKEVEVGSKVR